MRRLVTLQLLTNTLARLGGSGRRGAAVLRALVEERDPATAPTQSMMEDLLFRVVRRGGLPAPVRQYEVAGVRLDGAYPDIRLGLEADSRKAREGRCPQLWPAAAALKRNGREPPVPPPCESSTVATGLVQTPTGGCRALAPLDPQALALQPGADAHTVRARRPGAGVGELRRPERTRG